MSAELVGFASTIAAIVAPAATLGYWLGRKFEEIEKILENIDKRLEQLEERMSEEFERTRLELVELVRAPHIHLVDFMAMKGFSQRRRGTTLWGVGEDHGRLHCTR